MKSENTSLLTVSIAVSIALASPALSQAPSLAQDIIGPLEFTAGAARLNWNGLMASPISLTFQGLRSATLWTGRIMQTAALDDGNGSAPDGSATSVQIRELYDAISKGSAETLQALPDPRQRSIWLQAYNHDVAGLDDPRKLEKYDPSGVIGFCFGRAMAVHLLARRMGLAESRIRKLFVIGDLRSGPNPQWRFHVTTLVQGNDRQWYAIDPIMDQGPMSAREWIDTVQRVWDKNRKARFYRTPVSAVIPDLAKVPEAGQETGERIIEIRFDPSGKGFRSLPQLGNSAYELDVAQAENYFRIADGQRSPFDFIGVRINNEPFHFNGYFADLLRNLSSAPSSGLAGTPERLPSRTFGMLDAPDDSSDDPETPRASRAPRALKDRPLGLHLGALGGQR